MVEDDVRVLFLQALNEVNSRAWF